MNLSVLLWGTAGVSLIKRLFLLMPNERDELWIDGFQRVCTRLMRSRLIGVTAGWELLKHIRVWSEKLKEFFRPYGEKSVLTYMLKSVLMAAAELISPYDLNTFYRFKHCRCVQQIYSMCFPFNSLLPPGNSGQFCALQSGPEPVTVQWEHLWRGSRHGKSRH